MEDAMVADTEVDMVADMEVDKVADKVADMAADKIKERKNALMLFLADILLHMVAWWLW